MARAFCARPLRRRCLPGSSKSRDHRPRPDRRRDRDDAADGGSARRTPSGGPAAPRTEARSLSTGAKDSLRYVRRRPRLSGCRLALDAGRQCHGREEVSGLVRRERHPVRSGATTERAAAARTPRCRRPAAHNNHSERALPIHLAGRGAGIGLGRYLQNWSTAVQDSRGWPRVGVALLVLTVLAIAMAMLWFWWQRRLTVAAGTPDRSSKALSSFGVFLCLAFATPLLTVTLLEATEVRMIEISYGFVA